MATRRNAKRLWRSSASCASSSSAGRTGRSTPALRRNPSPEPRAASREFAVHPTTYLVVWLLLLVASQSLAGQALLVALLLLPLLGRSSLRRLRRLAWRTRWLFLSLLVILSWGSVGEPAWNGALAPTREGLLVAATHLGRLLLALSAVAVLFESMPLATLLTATHRLLEPLRACGVEPERGVVRLMLVLRYLETMPRPRDWRRLLDLPANDGNEVLELVDQRFSWLDAMTMLIVAGGVAAFLSRQV